MKNVIARILTGSALGFGFFFSFLYLPSYFFSLVLFTILFLIIFFEWKNFFDMKQWTYWLLMPLYPILPFSLLIILNHSPIYRNLILVLFILVSSFDTGGYIFGSLIGRHPIAPSISPGKTWEGVFGGYLFAFLGLTFLLWEQKCMLKPFWLVLVFTFIVSALSLCGDLFESWLKRGARIKDSGNLLPGHGGLLDRFDGILFTVFFFYFFKSYLIKLFPF